MLSDVTCIQNEQKNEAQCVRHLILWVQIQQDLHNSGASSGNGWSLGPRSQLSKV